jgi:hypothetical protein
MKRTIIVSAALILALAATGPVTAEPAGGLLPAAPTACAAHPAGSELAAQWTEELGRGLVTPPPTAQTHPLPPPCPEERDCTGPTGNGNSCRSNPANCEVTGLSTRTDTGLTACTLPSGKILTCPLGQTVIVRSAACDQCPCCSAQPFACLCPLDCGAVVRIGCG